MQILDFPERDLKRELNNHALKYVKKHSYYKSGKIITDFLISHLDFFPQSKEYSELKTTMKMDLITTTKKLINIGILTNYKNRNYKINKNIENFDGKLEIIANSINKKDEIWRRKQLKITDDEIKELYNRNFGVPKISKLAGCSTSTIYYRLKGVEKRVYWRKQLKITDEKIKELYDKKFGVPTISKIAGCSKDTIYNRLKDVEINNSRIDEYNEDEFIEFLNREYLT